MSYLEFCMGDFSPHSFTLGGLSMARGLSMAFSMAFFFICTGGSVGAGYRLCIMPRPAVTDVPLISLCLKRHYAYNYQL